MAINTNCPGCQSQFQLDDQLAGQQVQCQNCQTVFVAPPPNQPQPPTKQDSVGAAFDQFSQPQPSQDTFGSVYDQVAGQQQPAYSNSPPPTGYPNQSPPKSSNKGLIIGGGIGCGFLLLCGIGIAAWMIFGRLGAGELANNQSPVTGQQFDTLASDHMENMRDKHGDRNVVTIIFQMKNADDAAGGGTRFLSDKMKEVIGRNAEIVCSKRGNDQFMLVAAPVSNATSLSQKMDWANISSVNQASREIRASLTYSNEMAIADNSKTAQTGNTNTSQSAARPDAATLAKQAAQRREQEIARRKKEAEEAKKRSEELVQRERERLEEKANRDKQRKMDDANRLADRERRPRDGETITEWLKRCLDEGRMLKQNLESLAKMEVAEDEKEMVSFLLAEKMPDFTSPFDKQAAAEALEVWRTETSDQALIAMLNEAEGGIQAKWILPSVGKLKTAAAAEAITRFVPDFFTADMATEALIDMGSVAEEAVLKGRMEQDPKTRSRVYQILTKIGTRASLEGLKENRKLEKDPDMKRQVRETMASIEARHPE